MSGAAGVTISLTADQALVLFEWLTREDGKGALPTEHQAEQNVLWRSRLSSRKASWSRCGRTTRHSSSRHASGYWAASDTGAPAFVQIR